ncbi:hypothetical protein ABS71_17695 [bacterium SCN 62-11]|nr:DUF2306 domain-containing protein [Candidatus Eremiobacteraeota bacterium]ODT59748.1 MAG: hypothetical protein ABS71_17695 [bacterium SCN 62-11]
MWYLLVYLAALYATRAAAHILGDPQHFSPYFYDKYVAHLWLVRTHGVTGALNLLLGPWLLSSRVRNNWPCWHRLLGKLYFLALVPAALTGLALSCIAYGGITASSALVFLSMGWAYSGWRAYQSIRVGNVSAHRLWMFRHYALTLAAVSLRIQSAWRLGLGEDFPAIYAQCAWMSWLPNLLLAECYIHRKTLTSWIRW